MTLTAGDKAARLRARNAAKPMPKRTRPASPDLPPLGITEIIDDEEEDVLRGRASSCKQGQGSNGKAQTKAKQ